MDETLPGGTEPTAATAGDRLRAAREAAGLSLADVAARTRVPQRQLEAVEQARYAALPSPTYAIGFAKAYARTVGADEIEIAAAVRADIARIGTRQPEYEPYEVTDPARIPSRGLAIVAAGVALAVLVLVGLWYGTDLFSGGRSAPAPEATVAAAPSDAPSATPTPTPVASVAPVATGGQVRITATGRVWLRVYDTDDKTLYLGTMDIGDHFDVPADVKGPMINIGRPDQIQVTLNGREAPPLGASDHAIKDVKVDGASIAARMTGAATPSSTPSPTPAAGSSEPAASADRPSHGERHARAKHRPRNETARANLESARTPPGAATPTP